MKQIFLLISLLFIFMKSGAGQVCDTNGAFILRKRAVSEREQRKFDSSTYFAQQAAIRYTESNTEPYLSCLNLIGLNMRDIQEYDSALKIFHKMMNIEQNYSIKSYGSTENQIGRINGIIGNVDTALVYFKISLNKIPSDSIYLIAKSGINGNMGSIYQMKGDPWRAIPYLENELRLKRLYPKLNKTIPATLTTLAICYVSLEYDSLAMSLLKENLDIFTKENRLAEATQTITQISMLLQKQGKIDSAILLMQQQIDILKNNEHRRLELAGLYVYKASTHYNNLEFEEALNASSEGLKLGENLWDKKHYNYFDALYIKSSSLIKLNRPGEALDVSHQMQKILLKNVPDDPLAIPDLSNELFDRKISDAIISNLNCFFYLYKTGLENVYKKKIIDYIVAFNLYAKKAPFNYLSDGSLFAYSSTLAECFSFNSEILKELFNEEPDTNILNLLFSFSETNKSPVLTSHVKNKYMINHSFVSDSLLDEEMALRKKINVNNIHTQLLRAKKSADREYIDTLILEKNEALKKLEKLADLLKSEYPDYNSWKFYEPATLEEIRNVISDTMAMINLYLTKFTLFIILVKSNETKLFQITTDSSFFELVSNFRKGITTFDNRLFLASSEGLYQKIFKPLTPHLKNIKSLCIIPSGQLNSIPFEALISKPCENLKNADYLIKSYDIHYNISSTLWLECHKQRASKEDNHLLAIAPVFKNSLPSLDRNDFKALRFSEEEVNKISYLFKNSNENALLLVGDHATKNSFLTTAPAYNIIHIASHSFINEQFPDLGGIAFAEDPKNNEFPGIQENILYSGEIYFLNLNADLVVLSSCQSGIGKNYYGEGVMSLARGFFYAGSKNVMYSLWKVYDNATSTLMTDFYKNVLKGDSYSVALRKAKLKMISDPKTCLPKLWSGFLLAGN